MICWFAGSITVQLRLSAYQERAPEILCEALSRRLGRIVTPDEIGLAAGLPPSLDALDWQVDTLVALTDLGRVDVDIERRRVLGAAAYSVAALTLPAEPWWTHMAGRDGTRRTATTRNVGRGTKGLKTRLFKGR